MPTLGEFISSDLRKQLFQSNKKRRRNKMAKGDKTPKGNTSPKMPGWYGLKNGPKPADGQDAGNKNVGGGSAKNFKRTIHHTEG